MVSKVLYFSIITIALGGFINSPTALIAGFVFTLFFKNPFQEYNAKFIHYFLKISIVGLGFGMFVKETLKIGQEGFFLTLSSIILTLTLGYSLTKLLKVDYKLGHLISSGTAICGGSAIAAVAPIIKAEGKTISMALGIVFLLNAIALLVFPYIGTFLNLSQQQFGLWCAIAIHDTSSVVGAAVEYGDEALKIATTTKLARTLWIIPLSIFSMFVFKNKNEKIKIPYFILLFILAILVNSSQILPEALTSTIVLFSKRLLTVSLFLVGLSISIPDIKSVGIKPLIIGIALWISVSIFSLTLIMN